MVHKLSKNLGATKKIWCHKGNRKQIPYSGLANIRCHSTKFSCLDELASGICAQTRTLSNVYILNPNITLVLETACIFVFKLNTVFHSQLNSQWQVTGILRGLHLLSLLATSMPGEEQELDLKGPTEKVSSVSTFWLSPKWRWNKSLNVLMFKFLNC